MDALQKKVVKLDASLEDLNQTQQDLQKTTKSTGEAVLENGGAMGLLNDLTGGYAMMVKDAVEASVLFTKSQKIATFTQGIYNTVVGTSTGMMKAFRIALAATGVGALIVGLVLLIANFDKVKKAVLNLVPGLAKVGEFIGGIVDAITDFVGVTSDASRELDKLSASADKTLAKNKFALEAYGDTYDQYTKRKIEANNKFAQHVKDINEDEALSEAEKIKRLKILRQTADREILKAETDRQNDLAKKRKEEQDKINEAQAKAEEERKAKALKAEEDRQKAVLDSRKAYLDKANETQKELDEQEDERLKAKYQAEEKAKQDSLNNVNRILQGEVDGAISRAEIQKKLDEDVKNAKVAIADQTLLLISEIAGKGSKIGKAAAIAQATLAGVQGVQNAFTTASASPITTVFPAYPFIQAGLAGAFSALQIGKMIKGEKPASSGGGGGGGSSAPAAPSFNLVRGTGSNQIAESLSRESKPVKAFVVSGEVTSAQSLDRNKATDAQL